MPAASASGRPGLTHSAPSASSASLPSAIPPSRPSGSVSARLPSWAAGPPGTDAPPTCEVPHFAPVRVRGGAQRLRRLARCWRRALAAGLAVTAAALLATGAGPREAERVRGHPVADPVHGRRTTTGTVTAPVRIADGATVRLLRPGDRVDVIAARESTAGGARVVARGARVAHVPGALESAADGGALVLLSVSRTTASQLASAGFTSRLAVIKI
ncbi:hypothetical protein ACIQVC_33410 [Streptomyces sp. NPDC101112]|uniref:hypothetical protein n=1 Tax=Streptomyces sp. NPDC101112 TaxID=3366105 RepID=UPI0038303027